MMQDMDDFARGIEHLGLSLEPRQRAQFERYEALLLAWNERFNLTAVRTPEGVRTRHFLDSLSCTLATGDLSGMRLVDVGSGAGFPGLPLKILFPQLSLVLVESVAKKGAFLNAVVSELALEDVQVISARAEAVGQDPAYRAAFDWAAARAVAPLPVLLEYLLPLCRVGGTALAQKGQQAAQELAAAQGAIAVLGGGEATLLPVPVLGEQDGGSLVTVKKLVETPAAYPRRAGMASKRPL